MLIGAVPYLNSIPLIRGLQYDIRKAPPALLERLLRLGEVDIATAPVTTLFENPEWFAVPGIAIGTKKSARSVLFSTCSPEITFENVQSICLDEESRTSAHLIKVLLAKKYNRDLDRIQFVTSNVSQDEIPPVKGGTHIDGKLLIGDKALKELSDPTWQGNIYDLGQEWTEWTKLPFVFACWVTQKQNPDSEPIEALKNCTDQNLASLDDWIGEIAGYDTQLLREYFTQNMNYCFGPLEQQGLLAFHQYLKSMNLIHKPFDLHFIES